MSKVIIWPENEKFSSVAAAQKFWEDAGYQLNKDFKLVRVPTGCWCIEPKKQMTLAQDAIKAGFKIVFKMLSDAFKYHFPDAIKGDVLFEEGGTSFFDSAKKEFPNGYVVQTTTRKYYIYQP